MLIEAIRRRANGSHVPYKGVTWHFKPETKNGPHICDVTDEETASILLGYPELYRPFEEKRRNKRKAKPKERDEVEEALKRVEEVMGDADDVGVADTGQE